MPSKRYPTWRNRHEAVLLYMLKHPAARYREISCATGYGETHLSRIINAPEFRRRHRAHLHAAANEAARRMLLGTRE
jgi:hypothetical protein